MEERGRVWGEGDVPSLEQLAGTESVPRPEKQTCVGAYLDRQAVGSRYFGDQRNQSRASAHFY